MEIGAHDLEQLRVLEEGLWRAEVRFDRDAMERILAPDFFEYGQSSRVYDRQATLAVPPGEIDALHPLPDFRARLLAPDVAQTTYVSVVTDGSTVVRALRSSIWSRTPEGWQLRFHQGTPVRPPGDP